MALMQRVINYNRKYILQIVKHSYSISTIEGHQEFVFKCNFTEEEKAKVLKTLNQSNPDQLSKFNVSQNRIKNLELWKTKKGPFKSLNEVLEVEGLGEKVLEKICENIISENITSKIYKNLTSKKIRNILSPSFDTIPIKEVKEAVGIYLGPTGISWAKLSCNDNKLLNWNYESFTELPKKLLPFETFDLAVKIVNKLPDCNLYIFETIPNISPQGQTQSVPSYIHQIELNSMLLTLLNVRNNLKEDCNTISSKLPNKVYYLRSKIPARLFQTLVGNERVSSRKIISELLESNSETFSLPCTPITVEHQLINIYDSQSPASQELLGQALLLIVAFMDLCVYKNEKCINIIMSGDVLEFKV